jgi:hypothetical protein
MRTNVLQKKIPRAQILGLIRSLRFENLHGIVAGKRRVVDSSHEGPQSGVIIECAKLLRNVDKFLNLLGTSFGSIMAQDKGHHPANFSY